MDKILQAKCREILRIYEDVLKEIQRTETERIDKENKIGETEFDTVKKTIYAEGVKEGIRRLLIRISEYASHE